MQIETQYPYRMFGVRRLDDYSLATFGTQYWTVESAHRRATGTVQKNRKGPLASLGVFLL